MQNVQVFDNKQQLAEAAASQTSEILQNAISQHGSATWVLSGGTAPEAAYRIIAQKYIDVIDWSKVTFVIGDERISAPDSPDNNWHAIEKSFLQFIPHATFLRPDSTKTAESGAGEYHKKLAALPQTADGLPRFDLVWLGMGEDGHTLSLFPHRPSLAPTNQLVIPVHDSPKPPADRISLTFHALGGTQHCMIIAAGENKSLIIKQILNGANFPITAAASIPKNTTWLLDKAAGQ